MVWIGLVQKEQNLGAFYQNKIRSQMITFEKQEKEEPVQSLTEQARQDETTLQERAKNSVWIKACLEKTLSLMLSTENDISDQLRASLKDQKYKLSVLTPNKVTLARLFSQTFEIIAECLLKSQNPHLILKEIQASALMKQIVLLVLQKATDLIQIAPICGLLLQITDNFNLSIYHKFAEFQEQSATDLHQMLQNQNLPAAIGLYQSLRAHPYIANLIDFVPLFMPNLFENPFEPQFKQVLVSICELINLKFVQNCSFKETKEDLEKRLEFLELQCFSKSEQERIILQKALSIDLEIDEMMPFENSEDPQETFMVENAVMSPYLKQKIDLMLLQMQREPFGHFAISGLPGSGKMTLLKLLESQIKDSQSKSQENPSDRQQSSDKASRLIVVTLEETFDSKNLVGTYVTNELGEFVFKKGPLFVAAEQGLWLVLRNIDETPADLLSFLLPLVEQNLLQVTSTMTINPKLGFRIFALTRGSQQQDSAEIGQNFGGVSAAQPLLTLFNKVSLKSLMPEAKREDLQAILRQRFPSLFIPIETNQENQEQTTINLLIQVTLEHLRTNFAQIKAHLLDFRPMSVVQMFSLYSRLQTSLGQYLESQREHQSGASTIFLSEQIRMNIIEEICDVYLAYLYDDGVKRALLKTIVTEVFNSQILLKNQSILDGEMIADYITQMGREHGMSAQQCFFGRVSIHRKELESLKEEENQSGELKGKFVFTGSTIRNLEQIGQGLKQNEPLLLVGETGTGKTTMVQQLAKALGKNLHVFNMNQNTDSADLLGGFKSVDLKYLLKPVYKDFRRVFLDLLPADSTNNKKFLDLIQMCYAGNRIKDFIQCLNHGLKTLQKKHKEKEEVQKLGEQIFDLTKRARKLESSGGFIFQFVEGTLIQSIKNGDWVLLDEINLATDSLLNKLTSIVQGSHILLNERADVVETKMHQDFRVFMCMNPPYSSAGKKKLPAILRAKVTEIYVQELENENDLWQIIDKNSKSIQNASVSCLSESHKRQLLQFYIQVKNDIQKQTKRGNIGLRNLCRALLFIKKAVSLNYPPTKALFDSLLLCFASHLDERLREQVRQLILQIFEIKKLPQLQITSASLENDNYSVVEENLIRRGPEKPANFDPTDFILTKSFKGLLRQLASVVAVSNFAVILEGPTSAGKTSCVQYLASVTHNKVIRINNHMHTDVQEYLGSYVPDEKSGKLVFQEGVLVEAVRKGYWVTLDELNLAPSEVLEALNRLLDDNRELYIIETQTVVKAHPNFRIFATQNPTEGYGGRKELSEAFKNRFVLIRVQDVPTEELEEILIKKCGLPQSRSSLMVRVMERLQLFRSQANLFSGKNSTITVRDLLKWAGRINRQTEQNFEKIQVAREGFFVLGERSRSAEDRQYIQQAIESVFNVKLDTDSYYETYFNEKLQHVFDGVPAELNLPKIIASKQLKRLAVLVEKCLQNREPVLLVGETGCGKTTLCQVFASEITKQILMQINCHQNTETSDFIGCMRTRKNLAQVQEKLSNIANEIESQITEEKLLNQTKTKVHSKSKAKTILNLSKLHPDSFQPEQIETLQALYEELSCVFEWSDGILVQAMQDGALLLIDEISLANDSVLERLNSVFEQERTLVITEKSSQEAVKIVADPKFNMVATMNPSGDFGKKELSPALRNRMTEIWVDSYFAQAELLALFKECPFKDKPLLVSHVDDQVDLFKITSDLCSDMVNFEDLDQNSEQAAQRNLEQLSLAIFNIISLVACQLGEKFFSMKRKSVSIRDVLSLLDFVRKNYPKIRDGQGSQNLALTFYHAVELVVIDGVCLGLDTGGEHEQAEIEFECRKFLLKILQQIFKSQQAIQITNREDQPPLINSATEIGVGSFKLFKIVDKAAETSFAFNAKTTKTNLMKLLRAFTLDKPILIEGAPGVGKTSLVEQLAKVSGRKLVRVNLSEQTDMMDLLGSEYPTNSSESQPNSTTDEQSTVNSNNEDSDEDEEIQFRWSDGVLLQAIKEGHWLLIDEMNLAQQSVLEGLNALLDHRRTVFIPELNREFKCHPDFFVFACQNPSQSAGATSGRKSLPRSFLNRFTKIYLNELSQEDYEAILARLAQDVFPDQAQVSSFYQLAKDVELEIVKNATGIQRVIQAGSVQINMRDLSRLLSIYRQSLSLGANKVKSLLHAFTTTYFVRFDCDSNSIQSLKSVVINSDLIKMIISEESDVEFSDQVVERLCFVRLSESMLNFRGLVNSSITLSTDLSNQSSEYQPKMFAQSYLTIKGHFSQHIQSIVACLQARLPLLITTDNPTRLFQQIQFLATIQGSQIKRILLNERTDTTQLLGCFEQTSMDLNQIKKHLSKYRSDPTKAQKVMHLEKILAKPQLDSEELQSVVMQFIKQNSPDFDSLKSLIAKKGGKSAASRFEWVDSVLIEAVTKGHWTLFENANLCNPSILDRLNPLFEEGNEALVINEQGLVGDKQELRHVKSNRDFRAIFVVDERSVLDMGKDVSKALRNRCTQIQINFGKNALDKLEQQSIQISKMISDLGGRQINPAHYSWSLQNIQQRFDLIPLDMDSQQPDSNQNSIDTVIVEENVQINNIVGQKRIRENLKQEREDTIVPAKYQFYQQFESYAHLCIEHFQLLDGLVKVEKYLLKHIHETEELGQQNSDESGWINYLRFMVKSLQKQLKDKICKEMVPNQHRSLIDTLLDQDSVKELFESRENRNDQDSEQIMENVILLMKNLAQARNVSQGLTQHMNSYLLSQIKIKSESEYSNKKFDFNILRDLGPNQLSQMQIQQYSSLEILQERLLTDHKVFALKTDKCRLLENEKTLNDYSRAGLTLRILTGEYSSISESSLSNGRQLSTVLILTSEKELMSEAEILDHLEQIEDKALILETPNLILIPPVANSTSLQSLIVSQSFLYESLCHLKDWIWLQKNTSDQSHFRLTQIDHFSSYMTQQAQSEELTVLSKEICRLVLPIKVRESRQQNGVNSSYADQEGMCFEHDLFDAIFVDKSSICIRDLPSFFAAASSLQAKLGEISAMRSIQANKFKEHFESVYQRSCQESQSSQSSLSDTKEAQNLTKLVKEAIEKITSNEFAEDISTLETLALSKIVSINKALSIFDFQITEELIETLIVLPLETNRLKHRESFAQQKLQAYQSFFAYHLGDYSDSKGEIARRTNEIQNQLVERSFEVSQLEKLIEGQDGVTKLSQLQQNNLRPLIDFVRSLNREVQATRNLVIHGSLQEQDFVEILRKCSTVTSLMSSSLKTIFPLFSNILSDLFSSVLGFVGSLREYLFALESLRQVSVTAQSKLYIGQNLIDMRLVQQRRGQKIDLYENCFRVSSNNQRAQRQLHEKNLLWLLKVSRITSNCQEISAKKAMVQYTNSNSDQFVKSVVLDYFVRREVAKKMAAERISAEDEQVFFVPFKVKNQAIPEVVGKAMDEWTKEDVARMEREAEEEIERNFPSYFDEVQKTFFAGVFQRDGNEEHESRASKYGAAQIKDVSLETVFSEILQLTQLEDANFHSDLLLDRQQIVKLSLQCDMQESLKQRTGFGALLEITDYPLSMELLTWDEDCSALLSSQLECSKTVPKQLMNISEVNLSGSYNFYHDALPHECQLVYQPMLATLVRLRDIVIRDEYESPLLNESMFLANYMLTCFNASRTPLMKILTTLEFLLSKLEEWENTYASKRLNSVEEQITQIKMLVIRLRKIQILSWRNLLAWKKQKMIKEDIQNCVRLAHTIDRQVFDKSSYPKKKSTKKSFMAGGGLKKQDEVIEEKVMDMLDMFIRDSSLGVFMSRLRFVNFLVDHFAYKLDKKVGMADQVKERLYKVVNVLKFVHTYYDQFSAKLESTVKRLDSAARTKVKTLIDIGKWTVQKFSILKNNIDKTHRQLNKACKEEEEALLQNVQGLVIASSRKKYANAEDQLMSLNNLGAGTIAETSQIALQIEPEQNQGSNQQTQLSQSTTTITRQLNFLYKTKIAPLLPSGKSVDLQIESFLERLSEVRAINKKHIQVRAFYDLLSYLKHQGCSFSSYDKSQEIQKLLIENPIDESSMKTYFLKAYETYVMLNGASQVDDESDLKNKDVLRVQSFSRSLVEQILLVNQNLVNSRKAIEHFQSLVPTIDPSFVTNSVQEASIDQQEKQSQIANSDSNLTSTSLRDAKNLQKRMIDLLSGTIQRLKIQMITHGNSQSYIDSLDNSKDLSKDKHGSLIVHIFALQKTAQDLNPFTPSYVQDFSDLFISVKSVLDIEHTSNQMPRRTKLICQDSLVVIEQIHLKFQEKVAKQRQSSDQMMVDSEANQSSLTKRIQMTQKLTKVCYQQILKMLQELPQFEETKERKQSLTDQSSTNAGLSDQPALDAQSKTSAENDKDTTISVDLSIEEMVSFSGKFNSEFVQNNLQKLQVQVEKAFSLIGLQEQQSQSSSISQDDKTNLLETSLTLKHLCGVLSEIVDRQSEYLNGMCRLSYLSQRVFIYLIYQGFCGVAEKDDPDVEAPSDLEQDMDQEGCGLGDGQGGDNNITDQIEHEEQLEGLKNYESEEENPENPENEDKNDDQKNEQEEEDNAFEMKGDFDGELDDEPQEKDPEDQKNEENEDDELDKVDDMLDNQLWDQNMEDMEKKEQEEEEQKDEDEKEKDQKEDKEEIDLGDRNLDDQHLLPQNQQDKDLAAEGDDDKKQEKPPSQPDDQKEKQEEELADEKVESDQDAQMSQEDENGDEGEHSDEEPDAELPLDKNSVLAEEDQNKDDMESNDDPEENEDHDSDHDPNADKDSNQDEEADSGFETDQEMTDPNQQEDSNEDGKSDNQEEDDDLDVQNNANQAILEDEQIEAKEDNEDAKEDKLEKEQANLKKNTSNAQQQNKSEEQQQRAEDAQEEKQADASGSDLLFEMSKQLQKRQQEKRDRKSKENQQQNQKPQNDQKAKKEVENPEIAQDDQSQNKEDDKNDLPADQDMNDMDNEANEFIFDESMAEQVQGRLAADQIQDEQEANEKVKDPEADQNKVENEQDESQPQFEDAEELSDAKGNDKDDDVSMEEEKDDQQIEKTNAEIDKLGKLKEIKGGKQEKSDEKEEEKADLDKQNAEDQESGPPERDLIKEYEDYLMAKQQQMDFDVADQDMDDNETRQADKKDKIVNQVAEFLMNQAEFDYMKEKGVISQNFAQYVQNPTLHKKSLDLLYKFKNETQNAVSSLCEQLRIVLEPQLSQNLQGDYKTGKRLNMKKVISFIASHYRNDKIWLRRTMPSKRDYKILVAIDDTLSMSENSLGFFSLEALVAITEALNRLEVGKIGVARIRDRLELVHSFEEPLTAEKTSFAISQFEFAHSGATSADHAMANFVKDAKKMLDGQNGSISASISCPFVIILSDGRFNKDNVRRHMREAQEKRYLFIFVILDKIKPKDVQSNSKQISSTMTSKKGGSTAQNDGSIYGMRSAVKQEKGGIKLMPYLKDFPFDYYCVIRETKDLPNALGQILVQWFSMVASGGGGV